MWVVHYTLKMQYLSSVAPVFATFNISLTVSVSLLDTCLSKACLAVHNLHSSTHIQTYPLHTFPSILIFLLSFQFHLHFLSLYRFHFFPISQNHYLPHSLSSYHSVLVPRALLALFILSFLCHLNSFHPSLLRPSFSF